MKRIPFVRGLPNLFIRSICFLIRCQNSLNPLRTSIKQHAVAAQAAQRQRLDRLDPAVADAGQRGHALQAQAERLADQQGRHDKQQRAAKAWDKGYFRKSIVPVKDLNGVTILARDELVRKDTSLEALGTLKPSFQMFNDFGHGDFLKFKYPDLENITCVHTPGNSSGIVDGASLVLVGNEKAAKAHNLKPRARIVACALTGTEPSIMLTGPAPATLKALKKAKLKLSDIDLFELNEAFASVVLRYQSVLGIPGEKINVNGGAIAMGHPIGATGAMILGTLVDELERRKLKRGVATLCAGGGIGIATVVELV